MKNFYLLFLIFSSYLLNGQITINNTHMPQGGDTLRYSVADLDTSLFSTYQNSGSNLTWNFNSLVPIQQGLSEYIPSAQTPYNISNRIGEKLADTLDFSGTAIYDVYNFYSSDSSSFSITHRGATVPTGLSFPFPSAVIIEEAYTDNDEVYQFPLDYLDRDSSTYEWVYTNSFPSAYLKSTGYRINEVDAWGTLTTPFGTFNCIRVVTDIVGYDTVSYSSTNLRLDTHLREYKWLTTQFEIPALAIRGIVDSGVFIPAVIQYRDSVRVIPSTFTPIALFSTNDTTVGIGDTVQFSNLSTSYLAVNYEWDIQPSTFQYVNGTSALSDSITVMFTDTGTYDIKLVASNSSGKDSLLINNYIRVDPLVGISSGFFNSKSFSIYPNPAIGGTRIYISGEASPNLETIRIFDMKGKLLEQMSIKQNYFEYQLKAPLNPGVYFIQLDSQNELVNKTIVVK